MTKINKALKTGLALWLVIISLGAIWGQIPKGQDLEMARARQEVMEAPPDSQVILTYHWRGTQKQEVITIKREDLKAFKADQDNGLIVIEYLELSKN